METITFTCINCQKTVTERMHPIHAEYVSNNGGCCEGCCAVAETWPAYDDDPYLD